MAIRFLMVVGRGPCESHHFFISYLAPCDIFTYAKRRRGMLAKPVSCADIFAR
jgi:hypothetical protein